jgi:hypothetical protein
MGLRSLKSPGLGPAQKNFNPCIHAISLYYCLMGIIDPLITYIPVNYLKF